MPCLPFCFPGNGVVAPSAGAPVGGAGVVPNSPGLPLPGLPRSLPNGEPWMAGETAPAGDVTGAPVAPGRGCPPALPLPLPLSKGAGDVGAAGEVTPPGEAAPKARSVAAAPVGGGMFLEFSVLIFCFNCASLGTPVQPCSTLSWATFAFTFGGTIPGAALLIFWGAATTNFPPCTFVSAPDLAATDKLVLGCRSMVSRWIGRLERALNTL